MKIELNPQVGERGRGKGFWADFGKAFVLLERAQPAEACRTRCLLWAES